MTQLIKTAALSVDFERDAMSLKAHGALASMVQPVIKMANQRLAEEKPAQVRLKDVVASTWLPPIPSGPFKRLLLNEAHIAIGRPVPQTVSIEVTRQCKAKCGHCLIKEGEGELSHDEILRVIDEALEMGACIITFTEGDPLLREDIFELVRHVDSEKAVVNLFTPGLEMTVEKAVKLREAGLYNLIVGVYSTSPEVHDGVRGVAGAFDKAIDAIKIALNTGLMVTMSCHVLSGQVDRILDLYKLATELGVQELSVWEGIPETAQERLTQIEREKIIDIYRKINSTAGGPRLFANTYFEGQLLGCMAGRRWMHIGVDGGVRGCPYLQESLANIRECHLRDAWKALRRSGKFDGLVCTCPAQSLFSSRI
ncbi:MAG: pyrroloquinoline quinone biosynthesis protein PqqE [Methanosaeta sp. PtaB.Bin018]|nr:MAG: pyrroloquinoline quinone biosynthesis protein PqqE [Methanosaeta sp. PtaB.Bin018]